LKRLALEGRLDLADGNFERARAKFDQIITAKARGLPPPALGAMLGKAEVELSAGNTPGAIEQSQAALTLATSLQGGFPYSNHTGRSWLMLGRALQAGGDVEQARKAYETAITHLSNTVDADHPELLRARQLLAASGGMR
jgi:tetratricopeptide (TPR) repeat protein